MRNKFILISCGLLFCISLSGQCPDRDDLWKHLTYLNDTYLLHSTSPPKEELVTLLGFMGKMNDCPYRNDSTHILLLRVIARSYLLQGDFLRTVKYYQQAINIINSNADKPSVNLKVLQGCYYWQSVAYDSLNNFTGKIKALDSCYTAAMRIKYIDRSVLRVLYVLAENFFDLGDYHRCIDYAQRCESLSREYIHNNIGGERMAGEEFASSSFLWNVKALLELKNYEEAEKQLVSRMEEYKKAGHNSNLGTIFSQLAEIQLRKGNHEKALLFYNRSYNYDQQAGYNFNCKQTLKDIGFNIYFKHFNDNNKALLFYKKALQTSNKDKGQELKDAFESLNIFTLIGNVYARKGFYDSAHHYFQIAFNQIKPGINETNLLHSSLKEMMRIKKIHYLTDLIINKGDACLKEYQATKQMNALTEGVRIYKAADRFLDRIKTEQTELESKLFWRSNSRHLYENAIEACYLQKNVDDAFYFFERSRAVLLQDQLREQRLTGTEDMMKQTQLIKKIQQLKALSGSTEEIFTNQQELDRLKLGIQEKNPLYYQSFLDTNFITIDDVKKKILKDHQAMVELFEGDSAIYTLIITANKSSLQKINKISFESLSTAYISFVSDPEKLNGSFDEFVKISTQLYRLLFQNASLPSGRIIISPDGKYFPFEALVTNNSAQSPVYFQDDHAVSYTYSARYLLNNFAAESSTSKHHFIGIAPMKFSNNSNLAILAGSDESLMQLKKYFSNSTNLIGTNASKNNFLQKYYKYRIIQLYTHATDSGYTGEPMIYFSDSTLLLTDLIYQNKPATSLIVLSACQTASGRLYNGEGVFSFNRGFAAVGIPSSVSNLWPVQDQSSYKLTELFYKYISKGFPLDVALQKAKKEFVKTASLNENKLPYYWAASILVGQSNSISLHKSFEWKWIAPILVLLLFILWRKRKWFNKLRSR
ncbi:MAG TPA: CHAT domain-containing protein [Chitinophagaceae bacterium]|nr:CHAT domain-containing protein [Chitinophagaceae bacterium]